MDRKRDNQNAFDLLMSKRGDQVKNNPNNDKFVQCPNCSNHVYHVNINHHLDNCINEPKDEFNTKDDIRNNHPIEIKPLSLLSKVDRSILEVQNTSHKLQVQPKRVNAFACMNENAKKMYKKKHVKRQRYHLLNEEGDVRWFELDDSSAPFNENDIRWSSTVQIKGYGDNSDLELTISSAISSCSEWKPLVKRHSKFSVPVLKSILQKSVRRRRPMPSVRVAMELADKSFDDLIRRLPIICLEDTLLHPNIPFLVWLMVASSKEFIPPICLITQVMIIVFELSSEPWKDNIESFPDIKAIALGLDDIQILEKNSIISENWSLLLKSLILRRQYGGMNCDINMLNQFIWVWEQRFGTALDAEIKEMCFSTNDELTLSWCKVPLMVYSPLRTKSLNLVSPVVKIGIDALTLNDIHLSGIDFHVSKIIDELMRPSFTAKTDELIQRNLSQNDRIALYEIWMWEFSSCVNHRRTLFKPASVGIKRNLSEIKDLWENEAAPILESFASSYIKARISF